MLLGFGDTDHVACEAGFGANDSSMKLHGTIDENLRMAVASAERLRGNPIYKDTLAYWHDLLHEARRLRTQLPEAELRTLDPLIAQLELALAERAR
jgi:hypothetical protein